MCLLWVFPHSNRCTRSLAGCCHRAVPSEPYGKCKLAGRCCAQQNALHLGEACTITPQMDR